MTKAQGYATQLLLKRQSAYATAAAGNYIKMPFNGTGFGIKRPHMKSSRAGQGRDPVERFQGDLDVSGPVRVPIDPRYFGHWLTAMLGDPVTTGGGYDPYVHTFKSGSLTLPAFSLEVGHVNPSDYERGVGAAAQSVTINLVPEAGPAEAVLNFIAATGASNAATQGGTPTTPYVYTPFKKYQGTIKKDGVALGHIVRADLTIDNQLDPFRNVNSEGELSGVDPGESNISGTLESRFPNRDLSALAHADTAFSLEHTYTISEDLSLLMTVHDVALAPASAEVSGPGGYNRSWTWTPIKGSVSGCILTAVLTNDVAGSAYTTGA